MVVVCGGFEAGICFVWSASIFIFISILMCREFDGEREK